MNARLTPAEIQAPAAPTAAPQLPAENQEDEHASDNEMSDCESHTSQASHDDTTSEYVPSESRASIASQDFEQSKRKRGKDKGKTVSRHGCRSDHAALCDGHWKACYAFDERDQDDEEMLPAVKEEDIVKEENIGEEEHIEEDHDAMGSLRMLSLEPRTELGRGSRSVTAVGDTDMEHPDENEQPQEDEQPHEEEQPQQDEQPQEDQQAPEVAADTQDVDSDDEEGLKLRLEVAELRLKVHLAERKRKRED
ncbi:hypothetical protein LTR97_004067 [Elasticomyces elasticus]|uniref:Uncharacterized protein n=1 Tax=Elasticomyces elasticus TaxID=574655 RepID=A0AAN7W8T9_9PEZI|nr:hypothetical protein LTR97_004067 [Elasticomyces elasticus]